MALRQVAISGGRDIEVSFMDLDICCSHPMQEYHVGDCPTGVDKCVREWAKDRGYELTVHRADWDYHGRAAGPIRNRNMAAACDHLVAFWDGKSRGTLSAIREAVLAGKTVEIFPK